MRLIDADEFIEYLGLDCEESREENIGEIVTLEDFDRQPTAFNINSVIEKLQTNAFGGIDCPQWILLDKAIEIIKESVSNGN